MLTPRSRSDICQGAPVWGNSTSIETSPDHSSLVYPPPRTSAIHCRTQFLCQNDNKKFYRSFPSTPLLPILPHSLHHRRKYVQTPQHSSAQPPISRAQEQLTPSQRQPPFASAPASLTAPSYPLALLNLTPRRTQIPTQTRNRINARSSARRLSQMTEKEMIY